MRAFDWRAVPRNSLQGFFSLELPSGMTLHECTLHRAASGSEWVGLPGRPQLDREGKQRRDPATGKALYAPIVELKGKERRERFQTAALAAVRELLATEAAVG